MSEEDELGELYRRSRLRIQGLIEQIDPSLAATEVAACPGWSVHDVVAHLVGVIEDALAGRLDGPPSPSLTAEQVERHRQDPIDTLSDRWTLSAPAFEAAISKGRIVPAVIDVVSHEHDIRAALRSPGARSSAEVWFAAEALAVVSDVRVRIDLVDEPTSPAPVSDGRWTLRATPFEVLRLRMGRRTREQVRQLSWSSDPDPILDGLFVFGPATVPCGE